MADIPLKSFTFPGLSDRYTTPVVDNTLAVAGAAADAKKTGDEISGLKNDFTQLEETKADKTDALSAYVVETATGSVASFTDGADDVPVKDLTVAIEPVQSGSGDPSPSNVRPISGWTGANVAVCGVNVWDEEWELGTITSEGYNENDSRIIRSKGYIPCVPNASYVSTFGGDGVVYFYGSDKSFVPYTGTGAYNNGYSGSAPFTVPVGAYYMRFRLTPGYGTTYNHDISINYPATDTDYHAHNGSSVSVDWTTEAGTVYGGTLDVTTGVLTVDRAYLTNAQLLESSGWTEAGKGIYVASASYELPNNSSSSFVNPKLLATALPTKSQDELYSTTGVLGISQWWGKRFALSFADSTIASVTAFKAKLAENGTDVVYPLATPQTYQLTPHEVSTILGQNNIFADCGSVNVQYRADTKLYIDKVLNA